ncbi:MAG: polysaccharide biosynthesis protein [Actinomycetota bacterium]|nr:polysaccharide biosynthesis protein [Actinomycetota bacterium]
MDSCVGPWTRRWPAKARIRGADDLRGRLRETLNCYLQSRRTPETGTFRRGHHTGNITRHHNSHIVHSRTAPSTFFYHYTSLKGVLTVLRGGRVDDNVRVLILSVSRDARPRLTGRVALVTGGSGFLGSLLVERLLGSDTAEVRVLTRTPRPATSSQPLIHGRRPRFIVGELTDERVLREALRGADVVFHLAAVKSVELCDASPSMAIDTNVHGSGALIQAALAETKLERFIAISSDKACRPTTVYGLTKALMERMVSEAYGMSKADFGTVRCGNLWGSTGSVVARWQAAAQAGADLSVTNPEMTRFIMLRQEAVDLIVEATSRTMEGSVLCRVMPAYALGDLAAAVSEMHGVKRHVIGGRPGEKVHEDLVSVGESPFTERNGEFFTITPGRRRTGAAPFSSADTHRVTAPELRVLLSHLKAP